MSVKQRSSTGPIDLRKFFTYSRDMLCVLGADGVERVIEVEMDAEERKLFDASVEHVRSLVEQIEL